MFSCRGRGPTQQGDCRSGGIGRGRTLFALGALPCTMDGRAPSNTHCGHDLACNSACLTDTTASPSPRIAGPVYRGARSSIAAGETAPFPRISPRHKPPARSLRRDHLPRGNAGASRIQNAFSRPLCGLLGGLTGRGVADKSISAFSCECP